MKHINLLVDIYQIHGRSWSINWGGGGCIFIYSRSADEFLLKLTVMTTKYMNMHPPPSPNVLLFAEKIAGEVVLVIHFEIRIS